MSSPPRCELCGSEDARRWGVQPRVTWWRCGECDLFFVHPQPGDAELATLYGRAYYGSPNPEGRDRARLERRWGERVRMIEAAARSADSLDVGCGRGEFLAAAQERGWPIHGIEVSVPALAQLPRAVRARAVVGRVDAAPFPAHRFERVTLFDVIEHVRDPVAFLNEIRELLSPAGDVVITTPNAGVWKAKLLRHRWKYFGFERYLHLFLFTADTLERALGAAGFEVAHWIRPRRAPLFVAARRSRAPDSPTLGTLASSR